MTMIGEVYTPLIDAALRNDAAGHALLRDLAARILEENPDQASSIENALEAARRNLDYFCQYYSDETAQKVKSFYGLGAGFRTLTNTKLPVA